MGQTQVNFVWNGPGSPYYLPAAEMRQQAIRWGLTVEATTSHQRLQPLVVSMAILEYERQFKAAVDASWQAATTAAVKPDEGQEVAAPAPPPPLGAQPTTGSASTTEQPKEAAAGPIANSQWEVSTAKPRELDNPHLAGVSVKPRCIKCSMLLTKVSALNLTAAGLWSSRLWKTDSR